MLLFRKQMSKTLVCAWSYLSHSSDHDSGRTFLPVTQLDRNGFEDDACYLGKSPIRLCHESVKIYSNSWALQLSPLPSCNRIHAITPWKPDLLRYVQAMDFSKSWLTHKSTWNRYVVAQSQGIGSKSQCCWNEHHALNDCCKGCHAFLLLQAASGQLRVPAGCLYLPEQISQYGEEESREGKEQGMKGEEMGRCWGEKRADQGGGIDDSSTTDSLPAFHALIWVHSDLCQLCSTCRSEQIHSDQGIPPVKGTSISLPRDFWGCKHPHGICHALCWPGCIAT